MNKVNLMKSLPKPGHENSQSLLILLTMEYSSPARILRFPLYHRGQSLFCANGRGDRPLSPP